MESRDVMLTVCAERMIGREVSGALSVECDLDNI